MIMKCHSCGKRLEMDHKPGRQQLCPHCDQPLHCCMNCDFFDENAYHQCRESESEFVPDKTSANFCDYFRPSNRTEPSPSRSDEARRKLDELFGGS